MPLADGRAEVLILEDNGALLANYQALLDARGLQTRGATTVEDFESARRARPPDLYILDIAIGQDYNAGLEVCRHLRKHDEVTPILFLTSHDSLPDKVSALRLGGDDFIAKHDDPEFLLAKVEALLRRARLQGEPTITVGSLRLEEAAVRALWKNQPIGLSLGQFNLVRALAREPGRTQSFEALMAAADTVIERNTVATHIMDIRRRFTSVDPGFDAIRSVRGRGYLWVRDD